ncbi:MAG: hypothetical protein ACK4NO_04045 [Glycocaulis sp.]
MKSRDYVQSQFNYPKQPGGGMAKTSLKLFQKYLGDIIDKNEFDRHGGNFLSRMSKENFVNGKVITKLYIESGGLDGDDDWIVIEFGDDPAIAKVK